MLQPMKGSVAHSIVTTALLAPPTQRFVATEAVSVPVLVNVKAIRAGEELTLHAPPPEASPEKRANTKSAKREQSWIDIAKKEESIQRENARTFE